MANFETEAKFTEQMRKLETSDPAHADLFNSIIGALLNNDVFLRSVADQLLLQLQQHISDSQTTLDAYYQQSSGYTDQKIAALINGAPTTLDTLGEIAKAMQDNEDVVVALDEAMGKKANTAEFDSHVKDRSNPHKVDAAQAKAVSIEASQGLTDAQKANARDNIETYSTSEIDSKVIYLGYMNRRDNDLDNIAEEYKITSHKTYIFVNQPAIGDFYLHGGTGHIVLGMEYGNYTYGVQMSVGVYGIKVRKLFEGVWDGWKKSSDGGNSVTAKRIIDAYDGRELTFAYGAPGLVGQPLWIAVWNDSELRAISPNQIKAGNAALFNGKSVSYFAPQYHFGTALMAQRGYHKIKIKSAAEWMLNCMVMLYQGYKSYTIVVSGYNYNVNHWFEPYAELASASKDINAIEVKFGYDTDGLLWFAVPASSYTGLTICNINNGYEPVGDWGNQFSHTYEETLSGTVQASVVAAAPAKSLSVRNIEVVASLPSDAASHPDTLYIIPE